MTALAVILGFFLAGLSTAFVFLAGGLFLSGPTVTLTLHVVGGLIMWFAVRQFWRTTEVFPEQKLATGIVIPIPLLFAGILMMAAQPLLLPGLDAGAIASLASWLFFSSAMGFLSAISGARTEETEGR
ncbi:MAG: hypothetical protein AAF619_10275 [Pseudomonadota bacterium]